MSGVKIMARTRIKQRNRFFLMVALLLLGYFVFSFSKGFLALHQINQELQQTQGRIQQMKEKNSQLEREIKLLQTPEYLEKLAREQLGLVREGEISVIILPGDP